MGKDKIVILKTGYQGPRGSKDEPRFRLSKDRKRELRLYSSVNLNRDLHRPRKKDAETTTIRQKGPLRLIKDE